jgi:membrane protease subunit HflK
MARIRMRTGDTPPGLPYLIVGGLVLLLAAYTLLTAFYTVPADSQAVVLRFGKVIGTVDPGLHWKLPLGIDQQLTVQVRRQLKQEFGFGTPGATNPWQVSEQTDQEEEKSMVTGDLNAALVEWVVQYRIDDPEQYLFAVRDPDLTLRHLSESVMREVVGDRTVDEVITIGRQEIETQAAIKLQEVTRNYAMGLRIDQVQLKNVNPPQTVQASFNEVNQAQQEKERAINVANGEYNKVVPRATGEADQKISAAEGYATKRINEADGDVVAFEALLAEYLKAPEVTRRRIYLETMTEVLPKLGRTVILDDEAKGLLPLLNLGDSPSPIRTEEVR